MKHVPEQSFETVKLYPNTKTKFQFPSSSLCEVELCYEAGMLPHNMKPNLHV